MIYFIITPYIANDRPQMKELNRYLTEYSEYWESIGLKLGLNPSVLNLIKTNNLTRQRECFSETLQKWLQQDTEATWCKLELAITNAKREYLGYDALDAMDASKSNGDLYSNK